MGSGSLAISPSVEAPMNHQYPALWTATMQGQKEEVLRPCKNNQHTSLTNSLIIQLHITMQTRHVDRAVCSSPPSRQPPPLSPIHQNPPHHGSLSATQEEVKGIQTPMA